MADEILRGFEIVKTGLSGELISVMKFKPTEWGARQCASSTRWLQDRHPNKGYAMRAIVSVGYEEKTEKVTPEEVKILSTEELLADIRVTNGAYDVVEREPNDVPVSDRQPT